MGKNLERTFNFDHVNMIINHEDVRKGAELEGLTDFSKIVLSADNYCLFNDDGGFVFHKQDGFGLYEVHTQFLKRARGPNVLKLARDAANYMFEKTPCSEIITKVKRDNLPPYKLALAMGFSHVDEDDGYYYLNYTITDWGSQPKGL